MTGRVCARCTSALLGVSPSRWFQSFSPRYHTSGTLLVPSRQPKPEISTCYYSPLLLSHRFVHKRAPHVKTAATDDGTLKLRLDKFIRKDNLKWHKSPWKVKQLRFTRHITNLIKKGKVEEAREVFDSMKKTKVRAEAVVYNTMIAGYGRRGDMRTAFKLFNDMKKHAILPTDHTYTSLFAACTEAGPKASEILNKIRTEIDRRDVLLNNIATNALISALAACGKNEEALQVYLDMHNKRIEPDVQTFGSLFLSAARDEEGGLEMAQRVWSEMAASGVQPDLHSYNMMVQCLRDGGTPQQVEDNEKQVTLSLFDVEQLKKRNDDSSDRTRVAVLGVSGKVDISLSTSCSISLNFGRTRAARGVPLRWLDREDVERVFAEMEMFPDIRTFHLLAQLMVDPSYLLIMMDKCRVIPDAKFMIAAIRMQSQLGNTDGAKELLRYGKSRGIKVDQIGYQAVAKCCRGEEEGMKLLEEMKADQLIPNEYVFGALIGNAVRDRQYEYITSLQKKMLHYEVLPNTTILEMLDSVTAPKSPSHRRRYNGFKGYYQIWKRIMCPEDIK